MGGLTFSLQSKVMTAIFLVWLFALIHEGQGREEAIRGWRTGSGGERNADWDGWSSMSCVFPFFFQLMDLKMQFGGYWGHLTHALSPFPMNFRGGGGITGGSWTHAEAKLKFLMVRIFRWVAHTSHTFSLKFYFLDSKASLLIKTILPWDF